MKKGAYFRCRMFVLCVCVCVCVCAVCVCTSSAAARAPTEDGPKADNLRHTLQVLCGQVLHTSTRARTHRRASPARRAFSVGKDRWRTLFGFGVHSGKGVADDAAPVEDAAASAAAISAVLPATTCIALAAAGCP